jgi:predicted lipase
VESKQYTINYKCNNDLIPQETKVQISAIPRNVKWAYLARDVAPTDNLLADMVIIESTLAANRAVLGYEQALNYIIVSFRGSKNIINFIDDFNFPHTDYVVPGCDSCAVHSGFLSSYNSIRTQVMDNLFKLYSKYPQATLLIAGHSLGGAQATFAALDAQLAGYRSNLYSYGCPRIGNKNFANFVNSKITGVNIRTVYLEDPVPNLPPISFQFYHGGTEVHFYDCKQYLAYPKFGDEAEVIDLLHVLDHTSYECLITASQYSKNIKYI